MSEAHADGAETRLEFRLVELPEYGDHHYAVISFQVESLTGRLKGFGPLWRRDEFGIEKPSVLEVCLNRKIEAKWAVPKAHAEFYDKLLPLLRDIVAEHYRVRESMRPIYKSILTNLKDVRSKSGAEPVDTSDDAVDKLVEGLFPAYADIRRTMHIMDDVKKLGHRTGPGLSKAEKMLLVHLSTGSSNQPRGELRWLDKGSWDTKNLPPLDEVPAMCWKFHFKSKPGTPKTGAVKRAEFLLKTHWERTPYLALLGDSRVSKSQLKQLEPYEGNLFKNLELGDIAKILKIETGHKFTPNYVSKLRLRFGLTPRGRTSI